ncbi:MAG: hypothetical protein JWM77_3097 [Rhodospirillales bacterium]|jgi:hypothetical protein|nr:hypothetical protein [Rhodospirillales bacterium]
MNNWKRVLALGLFLAPMATMTVASAQEPWRDRGGDRGGDERGYDRGDRGDRGYFDSRGWVQQFDRRLNTISTRLDEARMNRQLSPREVRRLSIQRDRLAGMERQALADRYVTAPERERLDAELVALARNLRIEVSDGNRW